MAPGKAETLRACLRALLTELEERGCQLLERHGRAALHALAEAVAPHRVADRSDVDRLAIGRRLHLSQARQGTAADRADEQRDALELARDREDLDPKAER